MEYDRIKRQIQSSLEEVRKNREQDERQRIMSSVGEDLAKVLAPFLEEVAKSSQASKENIRDAMIEVVSHISAKEMNVDTKPITDAIEKAMGNVYIPEPKVTVNSPAVNVPDIKMPDEMNIKGWVSLMGVDLNNPLPVQLRDHKGNPIKLFENLTQIISSGGGGKTDYFTIKGFSASAYADYLNADNRLRVSVETGGSGLTDTELRASSVPVGQVSGAIWSTSVIGSVSSTVATGTTVSDDVDDGSAPVKVGGIARTANPTAVAGGDTVSSSHDDLGRQIMRPVQVRDLTLTAFVTVSNGTETTLRAAVAGAYIDLIMVVGANNSDAAVSVDIRAVTGGGVVSNLQIPANGTAGFALPVPYPQQETGNNWTVDLPDITGSTISFTALFSQEV